MIGKKEKSSFERVEAIYESKLLNHVVLG